MRCKLLLILTPCSRASRPSSWGSAFAQSPKKRTFKACWKPFEILTSGWNVLETSRPKTRRGGSLVLRHFELFFCLISLLLKKTLKPRPKKAHVSARLFLRRVLQPISISRDQLLNVKRIFYRPWMKISTWASKKSTSQLASKGSTARLQAWSSFLLMLPFRVSLILMKAEKA